MQTLKVEMKCKHILMFPAVLTSANITSSLYYLLVNLKCCFQTNPCLELSISRQPRFHYSIKLSSSKKLNSSSSKCLGGNLISYCACASARTSGRLSFSRFFSQDNCFSIASMEDSKDDSVSSVQPAFLLVAKHRIYKCGMHDLCLKIFRWLCIRHKLYNSVHAFS